MHCSVGEGLGEFPSFVLSILGSIEHVLRFFEVEELTDLMNNVKLYVYNFLSVLFSIHIRDDIV